MWIRKPDTEIKNLLDQKKAQQKSLKRPIIFGSVFGLLFMTAAYFGFRGGTRGFYSFTHQSGFNSRILMTGAFGFVLFFGLAFYHQKKGSKFLSAEDEYFRCDACTELLPVNPANTCRCGGRLEPADYYTWEE